MTTWKLKKQKRNALEQYGRRGMLVGTGIPHKDAESCIYIIYKICELASTNIKKSKIEIAHRMKNDAIIIKIKDRPGRDLLQSRKLKLRGKSIKHFGYRNEALIFINESLSFDTNFCFRCQKQIQSTGLQHSHNRQWIDQGEDHN